MNFAHGYLLWLLLVIPPALLVFFWWALRRKQALMTQFIQARLLPGLTVGLSPARQKVRFALIIAAVALLIVTITRPRWGYHYEEVHQRGLDIMVAIDTSKSMLATDVQPNRLARAKLAALDMMQQAKSDRLGLVAFAGEAFLQCPLTSDDGVFRQCVEALDVNVVSRGGTAIAEAIAMAMSAFKEKDNFKVLVLFTDGEDNEPGALEAAQAAAKDGMKIFTVGIGSPEGELLRVSDNKGRTDYIRDEQGNVVKSRLNEDLLRQIAGATEGGLYLPLTAKTVDALYKERLSQLPKSDQATRLTKQYHEQFHWPLGLAVLLLLAEMVLPERKRKRRKAGGNARPHPSPLSQEREKRPTAQATMAALGLVLSLLVTFDASASPNKALKDYNEGEYDAALKEYQRVLQKKKDDPRLNYNAGAAAYREDKFEDAGKYFNQSISAEDIKLQERGYYNLGNVLYRVGEKMSDKDKKKETWQTALTNYSRTLKLNDMDEDARFNYEFVKRKLEELEQEQQQQDQQQGGGGDQGQDKNDQQQQQGEGDQNQDQQQQGQQDQQQQDGNQKSQADQQKSDEQKKDQQQQPSKDSPGQQKDEQQEQQQAQQGQQGQPQQAKAMSAQEAERMLEAQEGDEQFLQFGQGQPQEDQSRPFKDW